MTKLFVIEPGRTGLRCGDLRRQFQCQQLIRLKIEKPVARGLHGVQPHRRVDPHFGQIALTDRGNELRVACGNTTELRVTAVKLEGRKQVSAPEFANGARLTERERLGDA